MKLRLTSHLFVPDQSITIFRSPEAEQCVFSCLKLHRKAVLPVTAAAAATVNQSSSQLRILIQSFQSAGPATGSQGPCEGWIRRNDVLVKVKFKIKPGNIFLSIHAQIEAKIGMEGKQRPDGEDGERGADPSASPSETLLFSSVPPSIFSNLFSSRFQRKDSPVGALTLSLEPLGGSGGAGGGCHKEEESLKL